ncbi:MAG: 1,2-phenylacetyl-CoA epoxidase subunit PaaC [Candidatus Limnocylindrales bacterium]
MTDSRSDRMLTERRFDAQTTTALDAFVLSMADDEFVIGFMDSEWTGIAPILEEDVAMSSISQDELGHARALYELLAGLRADRRDADAIAYDREPDEYRHAALLDHARGDWATTIARRVLYESADAARLASIGGGWAPLAELVGKIRREERYHGMHAAIWANRLASAGGDARRRFVAALETLVPDAGSVLAPVQDESALLVAGILTRPVADAAGAWRADVAALLGPLGIHLEMPIASAPRPVAAPRSEAFRWLWGEFTSVRRSDPGAAW